MPSLDEFVSRLQEYREASNIIRHHTEFLSVFLGTDPHFFDRLFRMSELQEMAAWVNGVAGTSFQLGRLNSPRQRSYPKLGSGSALERIVLDRYQQDLDLYGEYF